jgi:hypothetical protein
MTNEVTSVGIGATAAVERRRGWDGQGIAAGSVDARHEPEALVAQIKVRTGPLSPRNATAAASLCTGFSNTGAVVSARIELWASKACVPVRRALPVRTSAGCLAAASVSAGSAVHWIARRIPASRNAPGRGCSTSGWVPCRAAIGDAARTDPARALNASVADDAAAAEYATVRGDASGARDATASRKSFALAARARRAADLLARRSARAGASGARRAHRTCPHAHVGRRCAGEARIARAVRVAGPAFGSRLRRRSAVAAAARLCAEQNSGQKDQSSSVSHRSQAFHGSVDRASRPPWPRLIEEVLP